MKKSNISEKILIEELSSVANIAKKTSKGLSFGILIKMIRMQLRMSQSILSQRSGVPQSTISRIENKGRDINISTLQKILSALYCDLLIIPILLDSIDTILHKQARKKAQEHIQYIKGTMNLEDQEPDANFLEQLLKEEEKRILYKFSGDLWKERKK